MVEYFKELLIKGLQQLKKDAFDYDNYKAQKRYSDLELFFREENNEDDFLTWVEVRIKELNKMKCKTKTDVVEKLIEIATHYRNLVQRHKPTDHRCFYVTEKLEEIDKYAQEQLGLHFDKQCIGQINLSQLGD